MNTIWLCLCYIAIDFFQISIGTSITGNTKICNGPSPLVDKDQFKLSCECEYEFVFYNSEVPERGQKSDQKCIPSVTTVNYQQCIIDR